jgi:tripartite-type tricarboxylate transporter receptor subunit TctC
MPDPTHFNHPPSRLSFGNRPRLPRIGDAVRPWLIAIVWLMGAGLFKAALAQTPATPTTPASGEPPLTLVIPFSAGSGPDHVAHTMALVWTERSGKQVVVRNLPDRQGYVAARQVATAQPDGRVLLLTSSPLLQRPARLADDPFQPPAASSEDFTPIARVGQLPFVTVFPPGMFGRWLMPLATPPSVVVGVASALPASMVDRSALADPPDSADFDALSSRDAPAWNALLAPPHLPAELAEQLRSDWRQVMSDARVRLALAQTGTELWEVIPKGASR